MAEDDTDQGLRRADRIFIRISILQAILAFVGLATGCIALYAALNESEAVRKQQVAAVLPDIVIGQTYTMRDGEPYLGYLVINAGIGPGRIKALRLTIDETPVTNWREAVTALNVEGSPEFDQSQIAGSVIRPGQTLEVFVTRNPALIDALTSDANIEIEYCYCSVFEDCWLPTQSVTESPQPVKQCPDFGDEQFLQ